MSRLVWVLLVVVAAAAAVLSFAGLRDLALLCGFVPVLAWLLPVTVDAGAGVSCLIWLGHDVPAEAARFARSLTWSLLAGSVAGNAIVHGLTAYGLPAPWWLVVGVSAIAPAVLGATVHLAVLVGRRRQASVEPQLERDKAADWAAELLDEQGLSRAWETAPAAGEGPGEDPAGAVLLNVDRAGELIAAGVGRRKLARELGVSEHTARQLLARTNGAGR